MAKKLTCNSCGLKYLTGTCKHCGNKFNKRTGGSLDYCNTKCCKRDTERNRKRKKSTKGMNREEFRRKFRDIPA